MRIARRVLAAGLFLLVPQLLLAQADFEEYVEKIRKAGMTEDAESSIRMAAGIASGASVFEVKPTPDGKSVGRSYSSAMCFRPGADDEKAKALREKGGRGKRGVQAAHHLHAAAAGLGGWLLRHSCGPRESPS